MKTLERFAGVRGESCSWLAADPSLGWMPEVCEMGNPPATTPPGLSPLSFQGRDGDVLRR